jgi:IS5 family transposase
LVKWRTGSEGRISYLKHSFGWERTPLDGIDGARTWCGWGIFAHNATKIALLSDARETKSEPTTSEQHRSTTTKRESGRPPPTPKKIPA